MADHLQLDIAGGATPHAAVIARAEGRTVGPGAPCGFCERPIPTRSRTGRALRQDAKFCSKACRQKSHRFSVERIPLPQTPSLRWPSDGDRERPRRFAYADPPYPGLAGYYQENQEIDHGLLIGRLVDEYPDGWALSTSSRALRMVLALCPPDVRVCSWTRSVRTVKSSRALQAWEPLIVWGGRPLDTAVVQDLRDASVAHVDLRELLTAVVYRGRHFGFPGALVGMKPPQFSEWLFAQLGAQPGDELDDLFPGSGAVTKAWERYVAPVDARHVSAIPATRRQPPAPEPRPLLTCSRDASRSAETQPSRGPSPDASHLEAPTHPTRSSQ